MQLFKHLVDNFDFPATFWDIIDLDGQECRASYEILAERLGALFIDFDGVTSVPIGNNIIGKWYSDRPQRMIFDCFTEEWIPFTPNFYQSMAPTFTYVPRPATIHMELDYYVRSVSIPKHSFIWSDRQLLNRDNFGDIQSNGNKLNRCRYTLSPHLPWLCNIGKFNNGRYEISAGDMDLLYERRTASNTHDVLYEKFFSRNRRHMISAYNPYKSHDNQQLNALCYPFNIRPSGMWKKCLKSA